MQFKQRVTAEVLLGVLTGCSAAGGSEPTEAQMKQAMLGQMNHPPGIWLMRPPF